MKRQKLFAVLAAAALIFTSFGCSSDDGSRGAQLEKMRTEAVLLVEVLPLLLEAL